MGAEQTEQTQRVRMIVLAYPFVLLAISVVLNIFLFGMKPLVPALPSQESVIALTLAAVLLVINHTWLMTTTELTRVRFTMFATPEEWTERGRSKEDVALSGWQELERRHNAHRNATENAVYFVLCAFVFVLVTPPALAAYIWIVGFAIARIGHTYGYLAGRGGLRGIFMSLSLICLYGLASYPVMALFV